MKTKYLLALLASLLQCLPVCAIEKNVGSQKVTVFAFDGTTGLPKTGDSANITAYVSIDNGTVTALTDTSATEKSSTNAPGSYVFDLSQAETNGNTLDFSGKSSTSNVVIVPRVFTTTPASFTSSVAQTGDSYARIGANGVSLSAIPANADAAQYLPNGGRLWFVDGTTDGTGDTGTRAAPFDSISAAISAAAPGDTIFIYDGTYSGALSWTTQGLTLIGESTANVIVTHSSGVTITVPDNTTLIRLTANTSDTSLGAGINLEDENNVTLREVICNGKFDGIQAGNSFAFQAIGCRFLGTYDGANLNAARSFYCEQCYFATDCTYATSTDFHGCVVGGSSTDPITAASEGEFNNCTFFAQETGNTSFRTSAVGGSGRVLFNNCTLVAWATHASGTGAVRSLYERDSSNNSQFTLRGCTADVYQEGSGSCRYFEMQGAASKLLYSSLVKASIDTVAADLGTVTDITPSASDNNDAITITAAKVQTGAIDADAIAADAITNAKVASGALVAGTEITGLLDSSGVRSAVGLASANLDTQLGAIDDFVDTEVSAIKTKTDYLPSATAGASGGLFIAGSNAATTVNITGNVTGNLSGSVGSVTGAVGSVTGNVGGNVTGSVGSVTGNLGGNVTGSVGSISGVSFPSNFSALGINSSGHISRVTLADTLTTYTSNTPQTGDSYARLGAPAGASIADDISNIEGGGGGGDPTGWDETKALIELNLDAKVSDAVEAAEEGGGGTVPSRDLLPTQFTWQLKPSGAGALRSTNKLVLPPGVEDFRAGANCKIKAILPPGIVLNEITEPTSSDSDAVTATLTVGSSHDGYEAKYEVTTEPDAAAGDYWLTTTATNSAGDGPVVIYLGVTVEAPPE